MSQTCFPNERTRYTVEASEVRADPLQPLNDKAIRKQRALAAFELARRELEALEREERQGVQPTSETNGIAHLADAAEAVANRSATSNAEASHTVEVEQVDGHVRKTDDSAVPEVATTIKSTAQRVRLMEPIEITTVKTDMPADIQVDDEGYPLWPDGDMQFVADDIGLFRNWGKTNWQTRHSDSRTTVHAQTVNKHCLGAYVCSSQNCAAVGRPQTKPYARAKKIGTSCMVRTCPGVIVYVECPARLRFDTQKDGTRGVLRHRGVHAHARPPIHIPDNISKQMFSERVLAAPDVRPSKLKVGQAHGSEGLLSSVRTINECFSDIDRIAYRRQTALKGAKAIGKGDLAIADPAPGEACDNKVAKTAL